jgi:hypothetical protein
MKFSSRFFLYAPVAAIVLLAVGASVYWWRATDAFEAKLAALKGHEAIPGVTLNWSKVNVSGFPFRLDAVFDGFSARGQGAHGPFAWESEHFALHALTYGAEKDVFEAAGNQHLIWTDAEGATHDFAFLPGSLRASAVRNDGSLTRFDVDIIELDGKGLNIGRAQFHMRRDPDGKSIDLEASADLAKGDLGVLGSQIRTLRLYQTIPKGAAFDGLLRGQQSAQAADAAWRATLPGKEMEVRQFEGDAKANLSSPPVVEALGRLLSPLY